MCSNFLNSSGAFRVANCSRSSGNQLSQVRLEKSGTTKERCSIQESWRKDKVPLHSNNGCSGQRRGVDNLFSSRLPKKRIMKKSFSLDINCGFDEPISLEDPGEWGGLTNKVLHLTHTTELLAELVSLLQELDEPLDGGAVIAELMPGLEDEYSSTVELSVEIFSAEELEPEPRKMIRQSIIEYMPDACACVLIVQRLCVENITRLPTSGNCPAVFLSARVQRNSVGRILKPSSNMVLQPRPIRPLSAQNDLALSHEFLQMKPASLPVNSHKLEQCLAQQSEAFGVSVITPEGGKCFLLARPNFPSALDKHFSNSGMKKQSLDVCYAICDQRLRAQLELLI
mmetsp:Transcript_13989/g.19237  ORF Transcript_13989/g.19237 Transcript_13989/m.19237 type:complete len:341 (-) Transcript_13989:1618-2640(-)